MDVEALPNDKHNWYTTVTFDDRAEYELFCGETPRYSRLQYQYTTGNPHMRGHNRLLFNLQQRVVTFALGNKMPHEFPHQEVVTDGVLARVAGSMLHFQGSPMTPERRTVHEKVLEPILGHFALRGAQAKADMESRARV